MLGLWILKCLNHFNFGEFLNALNIYHDPIWLRNMLLKVAKRLYLYYSISDTELHAKSEIDILYFRYHIPRSFLQPKGNQLVLFEEESGNPLQITIGSVARNKECALVSNSNLLHVNSSKNHKRNSWKHEKHFDRRQRVQLQCPGSTKSLLVNAQCSWGWATQYSCLRRALAYRKTYTYMHTHESHTQVSAWNTDLFSAEL